jgi:DNA polymerase-3 subunit gamma/tau
VTTPAARPQAVPPAPPAPEKTVAPKSSPNSSPNSPPNDAAASAGRTEWHTLLAALALSGPARSLAQHCVLHKLEAASCVLQLAAEHQSLLSSGLQARLEQALRQHLGREIKLSIEIVDGDICQVTPAQTAAAERKTRQDTARRDIENDGFVRDATDLLDATVDTNSIQAIDTTP